MALTAKIDSEAGEPTLAHTAYEQIKEGIFSFALVPGDRFSEAELAQRLGMSRTPIREALARLQREGYLQVHFRSGWSVKPLDFDQFEHLYDLRMVLETTAVKRICEGEDQTLHGAALEGLRAVWLVTKSERLSDGAKVALLDEQFHLTLVEAAGNPEIARVHRAVTERIRIIRRLDFTQPARIENTYDEHAAILKVLARRRSEQAEMLLRSHIEQSKAEVRKITLHKLYMAREQAAEHRWPGPISTDPLALFNNANS